MQAVPATLSLAFVLTTALTVGLFYLAAGRSRPTLYGLLAWLAGQAVVVLTGFYDAPQALPPRLLLAIGPPLLLTAALLLTERGRRYLDTLHPQWLTLLHVVRLPVELVLLGLFVYGAVPELMTLEGRNWDILSGLSAPVVYYLAYQRRQLGSTALLIWNGFGLLLLLNVVFYAVLAVPGPLQRFGFGQPNVAVLHFPFVWLPGCVVPLVLLAHLAAIRQLARARKVVPAVC
ncbi:hypothetical protein [Hymenobacter cellulosilyticus]|uniref:Uncharacterized protein n=1 Tax=Hymenobacter cellulosilyticus TaxID=2932248 RepID=A0A8T9PYS2_9BACT|nr:hypothetical protein [Hymenobacter cellulosilyticus]UOQ70394.1 hypothetical protein MUN79_16795 [Hymenobacter cellulosilyticus]